MNEKYPTEEPKITKINIDLNSTTVKKMDFKNVSIVRDEAKTILNKKRQLTDLSENTDFFANKKSFTTEEYNSRWRSTYNLLSNSTDIDERIQLRNVWHTQPNDIQLTEQYLIQATAMIENDQPFTFMPDCNNKFTHFPSDALSLQNNNCLTGTIMDTFLKCMTTNVADGSTNNTMNVFNTSFYPKLVNTFHNDTTCPGWNTYNYNGVTQYTNHFSREDILKTTIIPIHIPGHWLLCIIDPSMQTFFFLDSLRQLNIVIIKNIRMWFNSELERLNYDTSHNLRFHIYNWNLVNSNNLPSHVPRQNDSTSCGVFVLMFAFYWYKFNKLPDLNIDWNSNDINSSTPNLRQYILHFIIKTIHDETIRLLDLS